MPLKTIKFSTMAHAKSAANTFRSGKSKRQSVEDVIASLRKARKEDDTGKFKTWTPRYLGSRRNASASACNH